MMPAALLFICAAISGTVTREDTGAPAAAAQVRLVRPGFTRTGREWFLVSSTRTDASGSYRIEGVPPGTYFVGARVNVQPPLVAPYFYSQQVEVSGADRTGVAVRVSKPSGVRVSGHVGGGILDRGTPPIAILIRTSPRGQEEIGATVIARDGTFVFESVPPGSYSIKASPLLASLDLEVRAANITNIALSASPLMVVSGRVHGEGQGARVGGLQLVLIPDDGNAALAVTAPDGSFTFKDVAPGRYIIRLGRREQVYLVADGELDLKAPPAVLDLLVKAPAGSIEGRTTGIVYVALVPDPPDRHRRSLYRTITSDFSGAFSFTGLAPGHYKLFAWKHLDPGAEQNPEFLAPFESRGKSISVKPGEKLSVELSVLR